MQKLIDVIDIIYVMEYLDNMSIDETLLSTSTAFDKGEPTESINNDLYSLKDALDKHDKIFIAQDVFSYDDYDEPCFIFGEDDFLEDSEFGDEYYDKYKFSLAGYGIYLDKDLNVEYGYFTIEAPSSGHGAGYTTFHDFKDAKDGDIIKEKIYSELNYDFGQTDNLPSTNNKNENNRFNLKVQELTNPLTRFVFDKSFDVNEKKIILNDLIKYTKYISEELVYLEEYSHEGTKFFMTCNCGYIVSKETKNTVSITCPQCGNNFSF